MRQIIDGNLKNITIAKTFVTFGNSLVEVFIPLLLLNSGVDLAGVCLLYIAYAIIKMIINYPAMLITNRWGSRPSLVLSNVFKIVNLLSLVAIIDGQTQYIALMAVSLALCNSFSWNAQHLHISRVMNMSRKGRDIAIIESIAILSSSIAPAVAAGLVLVFNSSAPLIMAITLIAISTFWLRNIDKIDGGHHRTSKLKYSLRHAPKRDVVANMFHNAHGIIGKDAWAIYLALTLASVQSIALVITVASVVSAIFLIFVGIRNDRLGTHKVLREGAVATCIAHLLRLTPASILSITAINTVWL